MVLIVQVSPALGSSNQGKSGNQEKVRELYFLENIWEKSGNMSKNT